MIPARNAMIPWVLLVLVGLAGGFYLWLAPPKIIYQEKPGPVRYVPTPRVVERVQRELVPVHGKIEFFPKEDVAKKMKMPDLNKFPDNVTAVGEVPPHTGKTSVICTLGQGLDNTWRGRIIMRQEPTKFLELKKEFWVEANYNVIGHNRFEGAIVANPLRTGPIEWTAKAGVGARHDGKTEAIVGIGLRYHF